MIKIITDSAGDFSKEEAKKLGLIVVPMIINFGEEEFYDGDTISAIDFYKKLGSTKIMPKTSLINEYRWGETIEKNLNADDDVIIITMSSKLSGTYLAATQAAEKFGGKVRVIDSMNAAIGERLIVLYALELLKQGKSADEIVDLVENNKMRARVFAVLNSLEYLKKGGRISSATAFAGALLSIKPIISVTNGEIKVIGKAFGERKGFKALINYVKENNGVDKTFPYGVIWSGTDTALMEKFIETSAEEWCGDKNVTPYILGGTVGTHIGGGVVGVSFFVNE